MITTPNMPIQFGTDIAGRSLNPRARRLGQDPFGRPYTPSMTGALDYAAQQESPEAQREKRQQELFDIEQRQQRMQMEEYLGGAGLRGTQQMLGQAEANIGLARIGDVTAAGQRAYTMGRESEELERLRMAGEGRRLQSQMAFQPQMEAIRGGIMGRMAGSLGVSLPSVSQPYSSGTGYTPSWMQNYQTPQFPRY